MGMDSTADECGEGRKPAFIPVHRLGWGFLLAWVFCTFYTDIAGASIGTARLDTQGPLFSALVSILPVCLAVVMLIVLVAGEARWGAAVSHRPLLWAGPIAAAVSSPLLFLPSDNVSFALVGFIIGALLTGFGSGLMWVFWGEFYARISQEDVERTAPASAVLAALIVLIASALTGWVSLAFIICLPIASGACFLLSWNEVADQAASSDHAEHDDRQVIERALDRRRMQPSTALRAMGRSGWGIAVACLFVCVEGTFWTGDKGASVAFQAIVVLSALFMCGIGVLSTMGPRRVSIAFLYRWMCPLLVFGFASIVIFGEVGTLIAFGVSIAARFAFCLITQMYFARFAARGQATPTQSYGLGWIFVHVGDLVGVLTFMSLQQPIGAGVFNIDGAAAGCIVVLVVATMFVLNDHDSFASPVTADGEGAPADSASAAMQPAGVDALSARIAELANRFDFTPREAEVFALLMRGRSIPYIRDELVISRETVATHVKHIYVKTGVHTRQELLDLAL